MFAYVSKDELFCASVMTFRLYKENGKLGRTSEDRYIWCIYFNFYDRLICFIMSVWIYQYQLSGSFSHHSVCLFMLLFQNDRTALHLAAEAGHIDTLTRLIDMKSDVQKKDKVNRYSCCWNVYLSHNYVSPCVLLFLLHDSCPDSITWFPLLC